MTIQDDAARLRAIPLPFAMIEQARQELTAALDQAGAILGTGGTGYNAIGGAVEQAKNELDSVYSMIQEGGKPAGSGRRPPRERLTMTNPPSTGYTYPNPTGKGGTWSNYLKSVGATPVWTPTEPRDLTTALAPATRPLQVTATMYDQIEAAKPLVEIVHQCPPGDEGFTPCCDKTPFELPRTDRITLDPALVTCRVNPAAELTNHPSNVQTPVENERPPEPEPESFRESAEDLNDDSPVMAAVAAAEDPERNVVVELSPVQADRVVAEVTETVRNKAIVDTYTDILVDIHTRQPAPPSRRGWLARAIHQRFG